MDALTVVAPAKLNLELRVLGRREDGQHEVDTRLVALDRGDRVQVGFAPEPDGPHTLEVGGPGAAGVPCDGSNLALRAVELVTELSGDHRALALTLEKVLPAAAGLGGGSADAAAAAYGAARLLGLDPDAPELGRRLGTLGADVPFFLVARATGHARCTGRGEVVERLPVLEPAAAFLVLTPAEHAATAAVYRAYARAGGATRPRDEPARGASLDARRAALVNDLERAACSAYPALARLRADLDDAGESHFRLAGSGSSFFALYASRTAAERALEQPAITRISRDHGLRSSFVAVPRGRGVSLVRG